MRLSSTEGTIQVDSGWVNILQFLGEPEVLDEFTPDDLDDMLKANGRVYIGDYTILPDVHSSDRPI